MTPGALTENKALECLRKNTMRKKKNTDTEMTLWQEIAKLTMG